MPYRSIFLPISRSILTFPKKTKIRTWEIPRVVQIRWDIENHSNAPRGQRIKFFKFVLKIKIKTKIKIKIKRKTVGICAWRQGVCRCLWILEQPTPSRDKKIPGWRPWHWLDKLFFTEHMTSRSSTSFVRSRGHKYFESTGKSWFSGGKSK